MAALVEGDARVHNAGDLDSPRSDVRLPRPSGHGQEGRPAVRAVRAVLRRLRLPDRRWRRDRRSLASLLHCEDVWADRPMRDPLAGLDARPRRVAAPADLRLPGHGVPAPLIDKDLVLVTSPLREALGLPPRRESTPPRPVPGMVCATCHEQLYPSKCTPSGFAHDHASDHHAHAIPEVMIREAWRRAHHYTSSI